MADRRAGTEHRGVTHSSNVDSAGFQCLACLLERLDGDSDTLDRLAERLADRVLQHVDDKLGRLTTDLIDTSELAKRLGRSVEFVRDHADELGVVRIGDGPKPRLFFRWPPPVTAPAPPAEPTRASVAKPAPARRRRRDAGSDLLPIRGQSL